MRARARTAGIAYKGMELTMVKIQQLMHDLNEAWERSAERAIENACRDQELTTTALNTAAGMRLRSGLKSGDDCPKGAWCITPACGTELCSDCVKYSC